MNDQPGFAFDLPLWDVASVSAGGTRIAPPHQGKATGAALHCSQMGAKEARVFASQQRERMMAIYAERGPVTDCEMEAIAGIDKSSICARRNELIKFGVVEKDDGRTRKNRKTGISNTLWRIREDR